MEGDNNVTQTGAAATVEGQDNDIKLPQTAEELQSILQSESDKRVSQALKTAQAKWEADFSAKLEAEKAEAAKLAKMTAEQRKQAEFDKQLKEFETQKVEFEKNQLKMQTIQELTTEGLPVTFADFLLGADAESTNANLNNFKGVWQQELQKAVEAKLVGATPKSGQDKQISSMSMMDIINKNRLRK